MSSDAIGLDVDYDKVLDPDHIGDVGVPHGAELLAFTNAVQVGTPDPAATRAALARAVGPDGLREAAATVAVFNGLVRVADGTGIQLDGGVFAVSAVDRARLGIDRFAGSANGGASAPTSTSGPLSIAELFGDTVATT